MFGFSLFIRSSMNIMMFWKCRLCFFERKDEMETEEMTKRHLQFSMWHTSRQTFMS